MTTLVRNASDLPRTRFTARPMLFLVEGHHDAEFFRHISFVLSQDDPAIPNLAELECTGRLVFIPIGGGDLIAWSRRFAPLGCNEIHIYDREIALETCIRRHVVELINARPGCTAFLTIKRSLENYLHPAAIENAGGPRVNFGNEDPMAPIVARAKFSKNPADWLKLSLRGRARCINRVKRWLNTIAVQQMTSALLDARDPHGEVRCWLAQISINVNSAACNPAALR